MRPCSKKLVKNYTPVLIDGVNSVIDIFCEEKVLYCGDTRDLRQKRSLYPNY